MPVSTDNLPKNVRLCTSGIMRTRPKTLVLVIRARATLAAHHKSMTAIMDVDTTLMAHRFRRTKNMIHRNTRRDPASRIAMAETVVLRSLLK